GLHADSAATFPVGKVSPEAARLLAVTRQALAAGVAQARAGNHVGDIGHAVQEVAEGAGYSAVRELVGHGIGSAFHEDPQVPNYGNPKRCPRPMPGMTLAIEPMVNACGAHRRTPDDTRSGWRSVRFRARAPRAARGRGPSRGACAPPRRAPRPPRDSGPVSLSGACTPCSPGCTPPRLHPRDAAAGSGALPLPRGSPP